MISLILYSRPECHLCDVAEDLLSAVRLAGSYEKVDIESDLKLLVRYGIRVPVLFRKDNEQELFWPFDQAQLLAFVGGEQ